MGKPIGRVSGSKRVNTTLSGSSRIDDIKGTWKASCRVWRTRQSNEIDSVDVRVLKFSPGAKSASSSARSLFAPLEQPRRFHPIRPGRECRRRTAPAERLGIFEEQRIGAQGRELLEKQCKIALFTENV